MCGITGYIDNRTGKVTKRMLAAMNDVLYRRGPDGDGYFIEGTVGMAMRRLSIIDLEGGWQPFFSRNKEVVAFQNGEIYNFQKLRLELVNYGFTFVSDSDTEVIAHGYVQWGMKGLLMRLDGMFAIAILDRRTKELYLARDKFGEKPLFYTKAQDRFAYSSSLLALAALPWVKDSVNTSALENYLALHYVPGPQTMINGVHRVSPGEFLKVNVEDLGVEKDKYYHVQANQSISRHLKQDLKELLNQSIKSRLISDVPVGVFLSGGLDSSIVATLAAEINTDIKTFSMGFGSVKHDESIYAEEVAKTIGSSHYHYQFDENSFLKMVPEVADALDEPLGDQATLPLYWLCREASTEVKVVLAGEGADEVFGGYRYYSAFLQKQTLKEKVKRLLGKTTSEPSRLQRLIRNDIPITPSGFPLLTDVRERGMFIDSALDPDANDWEGNVLKEIEKTSSLLQRATLTDILTWLPDDLLVKFDRMAMAHSIEGRAPFLDPRIVEYGLALPDKFRMTHNTSKVLLREVARETLPPTISERPKQGFVLPMRKWIQQWFQNQDSIVEYLKEKNIPGLNCDYLTEFLNRELDEGISRERLVFAVIMLLEWNDSFKRRKALVQKKYDEAGA